MPPPSSGHQLSYSHQTDPIQGANTSSTDRRIDAVHHDRPHQLPVVETANFTNPLFIVTNLSESTSYLVRIWSSRPNTIEPVHEQINITVRTRASTDTETDPLLLSTWSDDSSRSLASGHHRSTGSSLFLTLMERVHSDKIALLSALVVAICALFLCLSLIYATIRVRTILQMRKGKFAGPESPRVRGSS